MCKSTKKLNNKYQDAVRIHVRTVSIFHRSILLNIHIFHRGTLMNNSEMSCPIYMHSRQIINVRSLLKNIEKQLRNNPEALRPSDEAFSHLKSVSFKC